MSDSAVPNLNLERERAAHRELGETRISRGLAIVVALAFVATLVSVPLLEALLQRSGEPSVFGVFAELADAPLDACGIQDAETRLEERSEVGRRARPQVQAWLTRIFGIGSDQAIAGREGTLFQRAGLEHLSGPPFLDPRRLVARVRNADPCEQPPSPDPRPAILRFHEDLAARGIQLVLVPTPVKGVLEGDRLAGNEPGIVQNPSTAALTRELESAGVVVFDPAPVLAAWRDAEPDRQAFLATDTHWRPEGMDAVARALAARLEALAPLGDPVGETTRVAVEVENRGDLAALLELSPERSPYPLERATIQEVRDAEGRLWEPTPGAPVLLLGDSFSNIYGVRRAFAQSEDGLPLDWGEAAGFAEQLSHHLARPVDRIARNAGGSHATRRDLARALARRPERLDGVRIVVWQFAVRELSVGTWPILPLP